MRPRYPIYVPSKGRAQPNRALTIRALLRDDVPFYVVVEEQEAAEYIKAAGEARVLVLPFSGQGLIASRNWIRDHAEAAGAARHWQLDDNLIEFRRQWKGRRIPCDAGVALRVCEDLSDRYDNVGVSGLAYQMFVPVQMPAYMRNVHVYSCTLINHAMPLRWRLAYNDDTDICLQALAAGWTTLLLNAFMANKMKTMALGGGNTDGGGSDGVRYADGFEEHSEGETDSYGRYEMARSLAAAWPGVVKVTRRFGRYQHTVNWGAFDTPLRVREGVDLAALPETDEYGLRLVAVREPDDDGIRSLLAAYPDDLAAASAPEGWRGLPAFLPVAEPPKVRISFGSERERDLLVQSLGVTIAKKTGPALSAWWPPRGRQDLAALRWEREAA